MRYSKVIGVGSYLPSNIVTNAELAQSIDTTDEWIVERTGIRQRHVVSADENCSDMAIAAGRRAIEASGLKPSDIDAVIVATATPNYAFPSVACLVQGALNIKPCAAFDVQAACAGFIYALSTADSFIKSGQAKHVLVIGSEVMSRMVDWTDRGTCVLFGDGAGAFVITASEVPGILSTHLYADGSQASLLTVNNRQAISDKEAYPYLVMQGSKVFKEAVSKLGDLVTQTLSANGLSSDAIDWLVPHQANTRIINAIAQKLQLPTEKIIYTIESHSNTSCASIPLAMDVGIRDGRIQPGHLVLCEAFGAGLTWGSVLLRY